jgi:hypothetical protein
MRTNKLLISNVPVTCDGDHLRLWIEARGYRVADVRLIKDVVSGVAPSFAHIQLMNRTRTEEAMRTLNGQLLQGRTLRVTELIEQPVLKASVPEVLAIGR